MKIYDGKLSSLRIAFPRTLPVLFTYLFIGTAYGLSLRQAGFGAGWAALQSTVVYAGAMQFVLASFLQAGTPLATVLVTTLLVNSRHLFYGLSLTEDYKKAGASAPYMAHALTDETFSLYCALPADIKDRPRVMFWIAAMDQFYWIAGSVLGGLIGQWLPLDLSGIEFGMTALFITILVDQCRSPSARIPAAVGLLCAVPALIVFGKNAFMLPAMLLSLGLLTLSAALRGEAER